MSGSGGCWGWCLSCVSVLGVSEWAIKHDCVLLCTCDVGGFLSFCVSLVHVCSCFFLRVMMCCVCVSLRCFYNSYIHGYCCEARLSLVYVRRHRTIDLQSLTHSFSV